MTDGFSDDLSAELGDTRIELERIGDLAAGVSRALSRAFRGAVADGRSLNAVLGDIARSFSDIALRAAFKPVGQLVSGAIEQLFVATNPALGGVKPFARGGLIAAPTFFPLPGGMGLAGEAGPEAILPLKRAADGSLGVASSGANTINVTFNVTAPDARSFVAAEAEVGAMLLRAVRRGTRGS
ncbi:MAG TPA: phage tail tape measure protein [Alphaproteobacteria bacterium]|nr:phage tail tape measure protein [Alphaproteobacteria bacterium]